MTKIIKRIIVSIVLSVFCFVTATNAAAHSIALWWDENGALTGWEPDFSEDIDNSDLYVKVVESSEGTARIIYTGLLGGYDGGVWCHADIEDVWTLMVFDFEDNDTICIYPIAPPDEITAENSANITAENTPQSQISTMNSRRNLLTGVSEISLISHITLDGINVGETGLRIKDEAQLSCQFEVCNNGTAPGELSVIFATYGADGTMENIHTLASSPDAGETENISFSYEFDTERESTGKLMFWDSVSGLLPVRASIDFTQQSGINAYYYDLDNRLLQIDKPDGTSIVYTYDKNGNLLSVLSYHQRT